MNNNRPWLVFLGGRLGIKRYLALSLILPLVMSYATAEPETETTQARTNDNQATNEGSALHSWLLEQEKLSAWSADIKQVRSFKAIKRVLETPGKLWAKRPQQFRWQLGDPARTIAIRSGGWLQVYYPQLNQLERLKLTDSPSDTNTQLAVLMLEFGFPENAAAFYRQFRLLSTTTADGVYRFELEPKQPQAKKLIQTLQLEVSEDNYLLLATEFFFPDGSTMKNSFSNYQLDLELPASTFEQSSEGYDIVEHN